jgi:hypothetical protein
VSPKPKLIREVHGERVIYRTAAPRGQPPLISSSGSPPCRRSWKFPTTGFSILLLLGAGVVVVGIGYLGYQAISNPDIAFLLNQLLPSGRQEMPSEATPQTLAQIEATLRGRSQTPGQRLILSSPHPETEILIPVFETPANCLVPCLAQVRELRLYRSLTVPSPLRLFLRQRYFRLLDKVAIPNFPPDWLQEAELAELDNRLLKPVLPLTQILPFSEKLPTPGSWLSLSGSLSQSKGTIGYGHVWYVDPAKNRLVKMLNWSNSIGTPPYWQQVKGHPVLVVDQTVGVTPSVESYQLQTQSSGNEAKLRLLRN